MNGSLRCPNCNREVGVNNKFCPFCGGKLDAVPSFAPQNQYNNAQQFSASNVLNGRYRIENIMEKSDSYVAYLAEDITLQMKVVVNEFSSKGLVQEEARNRAKLSGLPGIAEMRDYFEQGETAYTIMEWLNGGSLQDFINRNGYGNPSDAQFGMGKRITMDLAKQMMEPIISSLAKAHDAGILHGDICPDNFAFSNKGTLKLMQSFTQTNAGGNSDKTVMLNMGYAPIENYHASGSRGPWSDVYSLCATIYKCITGIQPMEAGERSYQDTMKRPSELGIQIDPYDEAALMTGLAVSADKRFVDMKVLHKALYRAPKLTPPQPQPQEFPKKEKKQKESKERNIGKIIGIIAAVVALIAIVIVGVLVLPDMLSGNRSSTESVSKKEEKEQETESELSEKDLLRIELIDEQAEAATDYTAYKDVLEKYYAFAVEYDVVDEVSEQVEECFEEYQSGILEHVEMLAGLDVAPNMYIQMQLEMESVFELATRFEEAGIEVNCEETESMNSTLQVDYKQKLVTNFDDKAFETINSNGVISRSVLWATMENVDQTGLFDYSNAEDPLRLRYAAALAFHIDSELTGVDAATDTAKIYNSLEATDYSPLLLYYLSYNYGDDKATEWYNEVNEILASTIGDFDSMTINEKRNTIFYLSANDGNYATARAQIREYMQANFKKP